jgi:hypothetical protein
MGYGYRQDFQRRPFGYPVLRPAAWAILNHDRIAKLT